MMRPGGAECPLLDRPAGVLIAVVAANFGILRFLLAPLRGGPNWHYQLPAGLLPLAASLFLAAYLLLSLNRVSLVPRPRMPGRFAVPFIATVTLFLAAAALSFFYAGRKRCPMRSGRCQSRRMRCSSPGPVIDRDTPADRYLVGPIFLGVTLSAPPLIFALAMAAVLSRFQLVVTLRAEEPCDASASGP